MGLHAVIWDPIELIVESIMIQISNIILSQGEESSYVTVEEENRMFHEMVNIRYKDFIF